jgi:hypothetical protein
MNIKMRLKREERNPSGDDVVPGSSDKAAKLFSGVEMGVYASGRDRPLPFKKYTCILPFAFCLQRQ